MALRSTLPIESPTPQASPRIAPAEWRWLALVASLLLLVTILPILVAALEARPGEVFPGYVVVARDAYVYQALWHSGWAGDWLFRPRYTSEALPSVLLYPWYLWSGHLLGGLPSAFLYHAARLAASSLLSLSVYNLAAELYREVPLRRLAFLLAVLGGGIGLFLPRLQSGPVVSSATEMLAPGSSVADLVAMAPHLPLALALMCAALGIALQLRRSGNARLIGAGLLAIIGLQLIYPQLALLAALVIAAWAGMRKLSRPLLFAAAAMLLQLPYLAYLFIILRNDPQALATVRSALNVGDPFGFLVLSHTATTALIALGLLTKRLRGDLMLPGLWIVGMTLFMFIPGLSGSLGRSFMASSIPFALCALPGLSFILSRLRDSRWQRRATAAMLAIASLYGIYALAQPIWIASFRLDPLAEYEPADEAVLLARLAPQSSFRDIVLTTYLDGLFVPAQTNARVYAGHPDMTIGAAKKAASALEFFQTWPAAQRDRFLRFNGIDFVLTGDPGAVGRLRTDPALTVRDRQGRFVLFQVRS